MDRDDYAILKNYTLCRSWSDSYENVLTIGHILKREYILDTIDTVFDYFDRPWHYESEIGELIKEYELDLVSEDFFSIIPNKRYLALQWLFAWDIVGVESYEFLYDDMEDKL